MNKKPNDHGAYTDLLSACRQWEQENFQAAHAVNGQLKATAAKMLRQGSPQEAITYLFGLLGFSPRHGAKNSLL